MDRRNLFKTLAGIVAGGSAAVVLKAVPRKYGCLTIDGHRNHLRATGENLRVYVNGINATHCYEADDVEGYALVFCSDPKDHKDWSARGHKHIRGDGKACRMRLTGDVVIRPGAPHPQGNPA